MTSATKFAVVTGAGTGIGRASAVALSKAGFKVAFLGRRKEALDETLRLAGGGLIITADVGKPEDVNTAFATVKQEFGRLDLLFNNAGTSSKAMPMESLTYEQWNAVVAVNLTGAFLCTQQAIRIMKDQTPQGGRIINNGSISATTPRPFSAPYSATKHAITGLTKSTALDGRAYNIACGQIDIGNAESPMTEPMARGVLQANGERMPEPRMDVEHVAQAIVQMASLPLESNVLFMTIMATKMPFVGRG